MKFRINIFTALLLAFALSWSACDSNGGDPEESDDASELFFGDWNLTGADDNSGSRLGDLANRYNAITAQFRTDTTFTLDLDSNSEDVPDVTLVGSFDATISSALMRLTTVFDGTPVTLTFQYEFADETNTQVAFSTTTTQTEVMNLAVGTDFSGPTTLTFSLVED